MFWLFALVPIVRAQLPTVKPAPAWNQVPSGEGACSVGKSCAELAPDLIRLAMGASPLAEDAKTLAGILGPRRSGALATSRAQRWAVDAFQRAGASNVHLEGFLPASGEGSAATAGSSENVVAEIHGYEKSNQWVLIGASLDSPASQADSFEGACAIVALIDAVRVIHSSGSLPRRTIRFILFMGGGQGTHARAYVREHGGDLNGLIASVLFKPGAGAITGYSLDGRGDILAAVRKTLEPAESVGVKELTVDAAMGANNLDFILEGIPTLVTRLEPSALAEWTPEAITAIKRHSAVAAITAYALADGEGPIGVRQSRPEIEELLKNTGLDQQMKAAAAWSAWESGRRGRSK